MTYDLYKMIRFYWSFYVCININIYRHTYTYIASPGGLAVKIDHRHNPGTSLPPSRQYEQEVIKLPCILGPHILYAQFQFFLLKEIFLLQSKTESSIFSNRKLSSMPLISALLMQCFVSLQDQQDIVSPYGIELVMSLRPVTGSVAPLFCTVL